MAAGETATTIVRERGLANAVSWPRRVVFAWWLVLAALTAVLFADPDLDVSFRHDALSFTLETFNALVASMVAFVGIARYVFRRQPFDLAVAGAFGVIAVNSLWFGLILPFSGFTPRDLGDAPIYGWIVTRAVAGVLLLLGLRGGQRSWRLVEASSWVLGLVLGIALIDVGLWQWHGALPHLLQPRAWEILSRRSDFDTAILPGQTMLGIVLELGLAGLYLVLAMWLSATVERGADAWLALSIITAGVAELQFLFYPLPFHPAITTADLLWLISYLLLLAYLGHQYLQLATGMRRQQERAAALLALSQTTVASRDPRLVVAAAREAVRAVPAGV
ncbi:MAG: hypothetical protein IRY97_10995, partial [Thermomicrobiaceae bacterium]|nr:hypothetical protein [Thermomicrobiaceae bacterium]